MKLWNWIKYLLFDPPSWKRCSKASCWDDAASTRHMNLLSPFMPRSEFSRRVKWMRKRGCNASHLFLCNYGDGEFTCDGTTRGYSPSGIGMLNGAVDKLMCEEMRSRISEIRLAGMGVVLWLVADDSNAWARAIAANPCEYIKMWKKANLFRDASAVVIGLEVNEYWSEESARRVADAVHSTLHDMAIGLHLTSGKYEWARNCVYDFLCYQMKVTASIDEVAAQVAKVKNAIGKPVNAFELAWYPDRDKAEAAMKRGGAFAVGNW